MRRLCILLLLAGFTASLQAQDLKLPLKESSLRFAVIGDTGTGSTEQLEIAKQLALSRGKFPFEFAIMLGDNLYGKERPRDYENKFERPYKPLLDAGVKFYASLGNHDEPNQRFYKPFNMNGERYYSFRPKLGVRFFALDSNLMDQKQLDWLEKELEASGSDWKICFFHHPPYSSGAQHGSNLNLREQLEPLFVKHAVSVVFTGHEHFYERIKPQKGITYFIAGSSAKLRRGDIRRSELTAKGFDDGYTFMLVEIVDDEMRFETLSHKGQIVDSGIVRRANNNRTTRAIPR
jgi:predicted MPP superfamily phosphohydrolase